MSSLNPPTVDVIPPILPSASRLSNRLFGHYKRRARGVNIFQLSAVPTGYTYVYATDYPVAGVSGAGQGCAVLIPYPWNPNDPSGPYQVIYNFDGTVTKVSHSGGAGDPYIVKTYWGGHSTPLSAAEVTALTTAGFGPNIA